MSDKRKPPAKRRTMDVELLWRVERVGAPSLSPDGAKAVVAVTRHSMDDNKATSNLWLLSTLGGRPRALTQCGDKDGAPRFGPDGHRIAFVARRDQQGRSDDENQLYVIDADGGEARRVAEVATGVEAFRWLPDGRRIAFVSWVWPDTKGPRAQARRLKAFKQRKESGYATGEALYRYWDHHVPMGRVPRLHLIDVDARQPTPRDLFEGTPYELSRAEPDADAFDVSPDGRRIAFAFDPVPEKRLDNRFAIGEIDLSGGAVRVLAQHADWDFAAPRYAPDGDRIAFLASHQGRKHTMPAQLALWQRDGGTWEVVSAEWDHAVNAPLHWEDDGQALLFTAEQKGRRHLWRFDLPDRRAEVLVAGGWVQHFDKAAGVLVTAADAMLHPVRVHAHLPGRPARRIERFNDALLAGVDLGRVEEVWFDGASAEGRTPDPVQMWLVHPPGLGRGGRGARKHPVLHVIHGGPHTAAGDTWHYRWSNPVFAAQGYVVAAVNYHGSSGFGYAFLDSITHRWGQLELADLEAATDWLRHQPWVDRDRIYASGGSYGGYLVAWMNGHVPPGRYAAYVCHAGCFDWVGMFAEDAYTWFPQELGANYWDDMARVHAQSPHAFAAAMATPTLVIHGALDYRVPDAQGLAYYNTLKARGVDARLLWFPDENHWVLKPRNSRMWYGEFFAWLERHARSSAARRSGRERLRR
ncbi:MAG: prolyl oligopeptidase family serine peptidase [Gammaproteobacteria bacterium]